MALGKPEPCVSDPPTSWRLAVLRHCEGRVSEVRHPKLLWQGSGRGQPCQLTVRPVLGHTGDENSCSCVLRWAGPG